MPAIPVSHAVMSVEEFLAAEEGYEVKHEYLAGVPHAMARAGTKHNIIAANLMGILHARLRGRRCQPFGSDMKVKLKISESTYLYYPDAMIVCGSVGLGDSWAEAPSVLFEIISESTRRIDEREKRMGYLSIARLEAYVRIEQDSPRIVIERRVEGGWETQMMEGVEKMLCLPTVEVEFPIRELYERVEM